MSMRTGELTSPLPHIPGVARVRGIYPVLHPLPPVMGRRASLRGIRTDEMVLSHTKCSNTENGSVPHLGQTVVLTLWYESMYQSSRIGHYPYCLLHWVQGWRTPPGMMIRESWQRTNPEPGLQGSPPQYPPHLGTAGACEGG